MDTPLIDAAIDNRDAYLTLQQVLKVGREIECERAALIDANKRLREALEEIRELHVGDIDGSMEPGDDRFRGNKASDTVQIIDAVL